MPNQVPYGAAITGMVSDVVWPVAGVESIFSPGERGGPAGEMRMAREPARREDATTNAPAALARRFGSGAIEGRMQAFVITAMR